MTGRRQRPGDCGWEYPLIDNDNDTLSACVKGKVVKRRSTSSENQNRVLAVILVNLSPGREDRQSAAQLNAQLCGGSSKLREYNHRTFYSSDVLHMRISYVVHHFLLVSGGSSNGAEYKGKRKLKAIGYGEE